MQTILCNSEEIQQRADSLERKGRVHKHKMRAGKMSDDEAQPVACKQVCQDDRTCTAKVSCTEILEELKTFQEKPERSICVTFRVRY